MLKTNNTVNMDTFYKDLDFYKILKNNGEIDIFRNYLRDIKTLEKEKKSVK